MLGLLHRYPLISGMLAGLVVAVAGLVVWQSGVLGNAPLERAADPALTLHCTAEPDQAPVCTQGDYRVRAVKPGDGCRGEGGPPGSFAWALTGGDQSGAYTLRCSSGP